MGKNCGHVFDDATIRGWHRLYIGTDLTLDKIGRLAEPPISGTLVLYYLRKLGPMEGKKRGPIRVVEYAKKTAPVLVAAPIINEGRIRPLTSAEMMVGRAHIPRRIDRLEGVEA